MFNRLGLGKILNRRIGCLSIHECISLKWMGHNSQEVEVEWQKYIYFFEGIQHRKCILGNEFSLHKTYKSLNFKPFKTFSQLWNKALLRLFFHVKIPLNECLWITIQYIQIWIGVLHPVCYFVTSWSFESIQSSILNVPQPYNKYHTKNRFYKDIEMSNRTTWYSFICRQQMTTKPTERPLNMKTSNILFQFTINIMLHTLKLELVIVCLVYRLLTCQYHHMYWRTPFGCTPESSPRSMFRFWEPGASLSRPMLWSTGSCIAGQWANSPQWWSGIGQWRLRPHRPLCSPVGCGACRRCSECNPWSCLLGVSMWPMTEKGGYI